jgi:hypothetical protein
MPSPAETSWWPVSARSQLLSQAAFADPARNSFPLPDGFAIGAMLIGDAARMRCLNISSGTIQRSVMSARAAAIVA